MKIRIDDKWVSSHDGLLIIHLTDQDKKNIANMREDCSIYCEYDPKLFSTRTIKRILKKVKEALK